MSDDLMRILLIEDNSAEALLIEELLIEIYKPKKVKVQNYDRLRTGLKCAKEQDFDIILLDLALPNSEGLRTIKTALTSIKNIPIIVLTVTDREETAVQAIKLGAQDYITKDNITGRELRRAITYAIERKRLENQIKESEENLEKLMELVPIGILISNSEGKIFNVNSKALEIFDFSSKNDFMKNPDFNYYHNPEDKKLIVESTETGVLKDFEIKLKRKDGSQFLGIINSIVGLIASQSFYISTIQDITERKKLEERITDLARFPGENPNPVLRVSEEFIIYVNQAGKKLFQVKAGNRIPIVLRNTIDKILVQKKIMQLEVGLNERNYLFFFTPLEGSNNINIHGMDITDIEKRK